MTDPKNPSSPHGGDIYRNRVSLDFSVSLNPLGMPGEVEEALKEAVPFWSAYPDVSCTVLRSALSEILGEEGNALIFGNGAAELIYDLVFALRPVKALICAPSFSEYEAALRGSGCEISFFGLPRENDLKLNADTFISAINPDTDLVFVCNPNNPTGECLGREEIRKIEEACRRRQAFLCVDESFVELTEDPEKYSVLCDCPEDPHLAVIRAFTKTYAMAGIRLGYMLCYDKKIVDHINSLRQPWSVSGPAQSAGLAALKKVPESYLLRARDLIASERVRLSGELREKGCDVIPSGANFILFRSRSEHLFERCLDEGILIRDCQNFRGLGPGYFRIGIRTKAENDILLSVLDKLL